MAVCGWQLPLTLDLPSHKKWTSNAITKRNVVEFLYNSTLNGKTIYDGAFYERVIFKINTYHKDNAAF